MSEYEIQIGDVNNERRLQ